MNTRKNNSLSKLLVLLVAVLLLFGLSTQGLAKKPDNPGNGGGGGNGGSDIGNQPCIIFNDVADDVRSDDGSPYCNNKSAQVAVSFSNDGHLALLTNNSNKVGAGRSLFVDFGTDVTLAPGTANEMSIQTTDDALADNRVEAVSAALHVGAWQAGFSFFNMEVGVPEENVNLDIRVFLYFKDGSRDSLLLRLAPIPLGNGRDCPSSDPVSVTDLGIDNTGLHVWEVATLPVVQGACLCRSGEGFGDDNLLTDVVTPGLAPGHVALNFGFIVTAAP